MKKIVKTMSKLIMTLAVVAAPYAAEFCRAVFYEEREPEHLKELYGKRKVRGKE